uniref:Trafficking protein particle complex subunit 8 n=1 Tax=Rhabditophanes sp. KR3021 TaxID=114890 RepID=A0AC35TRX4_9BILA
MTSHRTRNIHIFKSCFLAMSDEFRPCIALLNSAGVYDVCGKNNLNFADMLMPYCGIYGKATTTVRDPNNIAVTKKISYDVRDITRDGFFLSLTVLPSVLYQSVLSSGSGDAEESTNAFIRALNTFQESDEHEFLRSYLACIFAVSAHESSPMVELAKLVGQQHNSQHSIPDKGDNLVVPGHCAPPKWFMNNILKFYILIQDISLDEDKNIDGIFKQMVTTYGQNNCHLLKINSAKEALNLPDVWSQMVDSRDDLVDKGLTLARKKLSEAPPVSVKLPASRTGSISSLSTVSVTSSSANQRNGGDDYLAYLSATSVANSNMANHAPVAREKVFRGCWLDSSDRDRLSILMTDFSQNALVPFVERQLKVLNDGWVNRKSILPKSFSLGMKKIFSQSSMSNVGNSKTNYTQECGEFQSRRLADLCVLFGLYSYGLQVYQSLKKDFENDGSWLHYAGVIEMAAICLSLSNSKEYPKHYMDKALEHYTKTCHKPILAIRAGLESYNILCKFNSHEDAANQMIELAKHPFENDLFAAILNERAAFAFQKARMFRKMAFQYVLTGYRFNKCGLKEISLSCYIKSWPDMQGKKWKFADDHILHMMAAGCTQPDLAIECGSKLLREGSEKNEEEQGKVLEDFLNLLIKHNVEMPKFEFVKVETNDIKVVYGNLPEKCDEVYEDHAELDSNKAQVGWYELERAAFHTTFGMSCNFKKIGVMSDKTTENGKTVKEVPSNEKCRYYITLLNPLTMPLCLRNVKLGYGNILLTNDQEGSETNFVEEKVIEEITLGPAQGYNSSSSQIELYFIPGANVKEVHVDCLMFDVSLHNLSVRGYIQLEVKGKRLNKNLENRTSKMYKEDKRLSVKVASTSAPLMNLKLFKTNTNSNNITAYCDQIFQINTQMENIGLVDIDKVVITTDHPQLVSVSEQDNDKWRLCKSHLFSVNEHVLVHEVSGEGSTISSNCMKKLQFSFKAPSIPVTNKPVNLIVYYKGTNNVARLKRFQVTFTTTHLLKTKTRLIDPYVGLCSVDLKNVSDIKQSVLIKIEVMRMITSFKWSPVLKMNTNGQIVPANESIEYNLGTNCKLLPVSSRQITIDNDQGDSFPFYLSFVGEDDKSFQENWWLTQPLPEVPTFSNHLPRSTFITPTQKDVYSFIHPKLFQGLDFINYFGHLNIFLLWKASIFNSNGSYETIFGESCLLNPYLQHNPTPTAIQEAYLPPQLSQHRLPNSLPQLLFVPSQTDSTQLKQAITEDQCLNATEMKSIDLWTNPVSIDDDSHNLEVTEVVAALKIDVYFNGSELQHNFNLERICTIPVNIKLINYDRKERPISVVVVCSSAVPKINSLFERHGQPLIQNNTIGTNCHLISSLSRLKKTIKYNQTEIVTLQLKTALPSVFDTSCFTITVGYLDSPNLVQLKIPPTHISVFDVSVQTPIISPNGSRCSSVPVM